MQPPSVTEFHPRSVESPAPLAQALPRATRGDSDIELSVVMPCLNEVRTVGVCVQKALTCLREHGIAGEVIVADNGSTDGSRELAASLGARVVPVPIRGYGAALAAGIAAARGRFVVMADSDDSYDLGNLTPFLERLRAGDDLVMGNRFKGGIDPGAMPPLHKYFGNPGLTFLGRLFFRSRCKDFYCGQRGFRRDAIRALDLQSTGMEFALEMLVKSTMTGLKVSEVPIKLAKDGRDRPPHLRSWRDGWRSLRFYLIFSPKWLFFYPGLLLMMLGLLGVAFLLPGRRHALGVNLDVHTLLYCAAATIVGFQLVSFAVFGKMLAIATGLHPRNPKIERLCNSIPLEWGLVSGLVLILAGVVTTILAVTRWAGTEFGNLDPFSVMRFVVPAVLCLILGCQVFFSSFYFSLLQVQCRKLRGS
jgi:glycosyltransferase involved in cell wall biosynthesis